jgi:hypothetical protein
VNGVATMPTALLPESARLLGIVCDALRLTLPDNRKANGRRFLTGERALPEEARIAVVRSLVEDALKLGYLGDVATAALGKERDRWIKLVMSGVIILMRRWDHVVGHLEAAQLPHQERTALLTECLRSAVVDLAIRTAAFRMLAKLPPMSPVPGGTTLADAPPWARPGGAAAGLARRMRERGLTRDALHATNALDDWLGGRRRPSPESLRTLAERLAGEEPVASWQHHLLWDFGLAYLADAIRVALGDAAVDELAAAMRRLVHLCIDPMSNLPPWHREATLIELVQCGAMAPIARGLCELLQQREGLAMRVGWARALALGGRPWSLLWLVASLPPAPESSSDPSIPVELIERMNEWSHDASRDAVELLEICEGHPALFHWLVRLIVHRAVSGGDFAMAAPIAGKLADALGGAVLHLEAATLFAGSDKHDEAARHLAAIPMDDTLRGAADALTAMMHLMTGRYREALQGLGAIAIEDDGSVIVRARAEALLGLGEASAALDLVELVIARVPRDAIALELAARCCTALGRTRDATRHAKAACRLGRPSALAARAKRRARRRR